MHIKSSPFWDIGQAVKFTESLGYKGLYSIEVSRHEARAHRLQHDPGQPGLDRGAGRRDQWPWNLTLKPRLNRRGGPTSVGSEPTKYSSSNMF